MTIEQAEGEFHLYALEWTEDAITTYVDGKVQLAVTKEPFCLGKSFEQFQHIKTPFCVINEFGRKESSPSGILNTIKQKNKLKLNSALFRSRSIRNIVLLLQGMLRSMDLSAAL